MRFQILSDIHTDGGRLRRNRFVKDQLEDVLSDEAEGIIFAGDICNSEPAKYEAIKIMSQKYKEVIVVLGNHDCWFKSFPPVEVANNIRAQGKNVHLLENSHVDIGNTRIHGTTLWFKKTSISRQIDRSFADFIYIPNNHELYQAYEDAVAYLRNYVRKGDVVVTHHTPSLSSVPEQFKEDPYTCFFSNDLDWLVKQIQPSIWIHGHTHNHFDYQIENTRILCNPYGYEGEVTEYKPKLIVDL